MSTRLTCHCGAVELEIAAHAPLSLARRCDCSFCKRRAAATVGVKAPDLTILKGKDALASYQWGTASAEHFFCKTCGIYTHHRRRIPDEYGDYGINIGCLEGVNPAELEPLAYFDGQAIPTSTG
ncbi:MAG: GFA family protein [Pseudomonadota bacterium]